MTFEYNGVTYTDWQIVRAYQTGDTYVQRVWYEVCRMQFLRGTSNYGVLSCYDREDLFQESFIILWEKMESRQLYLRGECVFVVSKAGDHIVPDLMGYFMRIVRNKYLEMLRSGKYALPVNEAVTASDADIFDELYWDEDPEVQKDRIVSRCLLSLPKSCLEILTMFFYEKKSLEQILAERPENSSYDGLKSRKSKCMTNLKKRITESFAKAGLR